MEPQLRDGDRVVVSRLAYRLHDPRRGDIVVFPSPAVPPEETGALEGLLHDVLESVGLRAPGARELIKRVIGLPGETLELRRKVVHVDGKPLDEPYVHFLQPASDGTSELTAFDLRESYGPVVVPEGHYFVMGDNRDNSRDSRYWGFLPERYIKGKALLVYWSYEAGRDDYADESVAGTMRRVAGVVTHFFTRTRWERMFHQIR